jgi:hypothetical protein
MKYKSKDYCECCNQLTWVRSDKFQGVVCKSCDEPTLSFNESKHRKNHSYQDYDTLELYPRRRKAI